jgi:hypothetical protein
MKTVSAIIIIIIIIITFVITFMRGIYNYIPDTMSVGYSYTYILLQLFCIYSLWHLFCYFAC